MFENNREEGKMWRDKGRTCERNSRKRTIYREQEIDRERKVGK